MANSSNDQYTYTCIFIISNYSPKSSQCFDPLSRQLFLNHDIGLETAVGLNLSWGRWRSRGPNWCESVANSVRKPRSTGRDAIECLKTDLWSRKPPNSYILLLWLLPLCVLKEVFDEITWRCWFLVLNLYDMSSVISRFRSSSFKCRLQKLIIGLQLG